jgi:hypothetical protein
MLIVPDTAEIQLFQINNVALETVREMAFSGMEAAMVVTLVGYYQVNTAYY